MKFNFLQGDFSAGELSPRAQGHADSDAYKAGLRRAANCAPTRAGSIASRGGLELVVEGIDGNTGAPSNLPVQHIPIHDGPYGDITLEISPSGIRILNLDGVVPWNFPPTSEWLQFTQQDGSFAYGDSDSRAVFLRSEVATGVRSYYLTKQSSLVSPEAHNAMVNNLGWATKPAGTNETWILSGKIAGDAVSAHIVQSNPANFQDIAIAPDANGNFSIVFRANIGGADQDFFIQLKSGAGTTSTVLTGLNLIKHNAKTGQDTTPYISQVSFGGVKVPTAQDRVRAVGFWTKGDFWVAFAGGPSDCNNNLGTVASRHGNPYAGFAMRWDSVAAQWIFGQLPCTTNSMNQIAGANTVAVFQNRLWYGVNLPNGQRAIRASAIGFGSAWGYAAQAGSTGATANKYGKPILFQFVVEKEVVAALAGAASAPYSFPSVAPDAELIVRSTSAVVPTLLAATADYTVAGHTFDYETQRPTGIKLALQTFNEGVGTMLRALSLNVSVHTPQLVDQEASPGGSIYFNTAGGTGLLVNTNLEITRVALANDPLDLNLASPNGKIAWLNVLRGLMLGTTRNEKRFSDGVALVIDPATGADFELRDESNQGADPSLNAVEVNDRIIFAMRGRRVLRMAGISITTDGGLVSEDVGLAGEHLTAARIRGMCFLKSPVQRVVFALDDGTGAVMSLIGKSAAFSRFTIPACFGGIYSVASRDGERESELWVGTENGVTLRARSFESDIITRQVAIFNAAPAAPTYLVYDADNPLPPVMDSWVRAPLVNLGGAQYIKGLPASAVGQNAYVIVNGQTYGPYVVEAGGRVTLTALGLGTTWVDAAGARRAQEVYVGILYPEHRWTSLPLEGGNPVGASQNLTSRKPQLHLRLVDSYLPLVNGKKLAERDADDPFDMLAGRVTGDRRITEEGFQRGAVVDVVMDLPLRMEISAIHGGVVMNNI